ncbi:DJ-1/PfpI family protein [Ideonella sp.]|uniref:DJ-1/PfpI family protein n=1 Tax=Ideonella sp. TaxID=1929293 RepID=UPI003BB58F61
MKNAPLQPVSLLLLMFDEVELLDFAGPYEVFTTANRMHRRMAAEQGLADPDPLFKLHTASPTGGPVCARAGLQLTPDHALALAPPSDWLVVPGGVVDALLTDSALLSTLALRGQHAACVASVCTGALVLAAAGLLRAAPATTHWEDLADLATRHPDLQVLDGPRWVDNGRVVTSAGIAAGIDMCLHLVARHAGAALAQRTARQMNTPWHPEP